MPSSPGSSQREDAQTAPADRADTITDEERRPADGTAGGASGERADGRSQVDLEAEVARMENRYKRALADLDNYRKRSAREVERRTQEAGEALLREWLEAVDSVERALRMEAGSPLADGMRAVLEQMEAILARHGVQRIGAVGEPFDPERHDAIGVSMTEDVPENTVVEVSRAGFVVGDRVLRPAQVVVARRPPRDG